jgi:hypothetical protein
MLQQSMWKTSPWTDICMARQQPGLVSMSPLAAAMLRPPKPVSEMHTLDTVRCR